MTIVPFSSVLNVGTPNLASLSVTSLWGWPYLLPWPAEIMAKAGLTQPKKLSEVEVFDP